MWGMPDMWNEVNTHVSTVKAERHKLLKHTWQNLTRLLWVSLRWHRKFSPLIQIFLLTFCSSESLPKRSKMFGFVNYTTSSIFTAVLRAFSFSLPLVHTWAAGDSGMGCFCLPLSSRLSRLQVFLSPGSHSMGCIVKAGIFSPMPVTWERVIDHSCHSFNWQTIWGKKKK